MTPENIVWLCALLCVSQILSAPINCRLDGTRIQTCHNLLKDMGGTFPGECINENVLITFPGSAFASNGTAEQNDSVRTAVYQTLHSINSLFENHDLPTEWDEMKLDDFQNIINDLVEKNKCLERSKPESDGSDHTDVSARTATLKNYFERLTAVLQEKKSFCAWEVVRNELVRNLLFILEHKSDSLLWPKRT
ncbi:interferon beta-like [Conger conger]|uniref:interferon beta-like n=1 Tax=Conger conger TaxID=82655 RepID=UPI002A5A881B|nr:interferon beta-like [Conger conger]